MVYLKRVKWLLSWIILWYPPGFLVGTVPTQILALYFYCFNPDYLFKLSSKPISLKKKKKVNLLLAEWVVLSIHISRCNSTNMHSYCSSVYSYFINFFSHFCSHQSLTSTLTGPRAFARVGPITNNHQYHRNPALPTSNTTTHFNGWKSKHNHRKSISNSTQNQSKPKSIQT